MGALAAAGWAWSARGDMLRWEVGVAGWACIARQADLSGRLGATGRCVSTAGRSSYIGSYTCT